MPVNYNSLTVSNGCVKISPATPSEGMKLPRLEIITTAGKRRAITFEDAVEMRSFLDLWIKARKKEHDAKKSLGRLQDALSAYNKEEHGAAKIKTDFANPDFTSPQPIMNGLCWGDLQNIFAWYLEGVDDDEE